MKGSVTPKEIPDPISQVKDKDIVYFTGMMGTATPQKSHLVESGISISPLCYKGEDYDHKTKGIMREYFQSKSTQ